MKYTEILARKRDDLVSKGFMHKPLNGKFGKVQREQVVSFLEGNDICISTEHGTHEVPPALFVYPLGHLMHLELYWLQ
jgi:hypothetical protein